MLLPTGRARRARAARPVGKTCASGAGTRGARVPRRPSFPRTGGGRRRARAPGRGDWLPREAPRAPSGGAPSLPGGARLGAGEPSGSGLRAPLARPPAAGRPEPASLSRSPPVMVADQRLPRVPAESGTIPRLCELLLGAGETKGKCQEHVNQTRYSVTITSLSGLPGPQHPGAPRAQARHLRGALARVLGTDRPLCPCSPEVSAWAGRKN